MGIRYIITPQNEDGYNETQKFNMQAGSVFFATYLDVHDIDPNDPAEGINLIYDGEHITHELLGRHPQHMYHRYHFSPSNVMLTTEYDIEIEIVSRGIKITQFMMDGATEFVEELRRFLDTRISDQAKTAGRNLAMVKELGTSKQLPENINSEIAKYISGKKGSLPSQINKLHQNTGLSLAPRPRKTRRGNKRKF